MGITFIDTETKITRRIELAHNILNLLNQRRIKHRLIIVDQKWSYHRRIASKHCNRE